MLGKSIGWLWLRQWDIDPLLGQKTLCKWITINNPVTMTIYHYIFSKIQIPKRNMGFLS